MSNEHVIRAWKDAEYRNSLSADEQAMLPQNPAGLVELTDADLGLVSGAGSVEPQSTSAMCVTTIVTIITVSVSATASCVNC